MPNLGLAWIFIDLGRPIQAFGPSIMGCQRHHLSPYSLLNLAKMVIYHCLQNIQQSTIFLKLEFVELHKFVFQKLELFEQIAFKFTVLFFMELKFLELKLHKKISKFFHRTQVELEYNGKFEFPKLEFPISSRSLHISKIMVDCKIFSKTVIFDHFDL